MLEPIPRLPDGVLGYRATGALTVDDYEQVVIPAVRALRARAMACAWSSISPKCRV